MQDHLFNAPWCHSLIGIAWKNFENETSELSDSHEATNRHSQRNQICPIHGFLSVWCDDGAGGGESIPTGWIGPPKAGSSKRMSNRI
jgi:hypothetical protein